MPDRRSRGAGLAGLTAALLLLSGCSPDDVTGVTATQAGVPVVTNCGAFIDGVTALDADTGRVVWAAEVDEQSGQERTSVDAVTIGGLPERWIEAVPWDGDASPPARWTLEVSRGAVAEPVVLTVDGAQLEFGNVILADGRQVTERDFVDDVCGYGPPDDALRVLVLSVSMAAILGAVAVLAARRGTKRRRGPVS